jgi:hypothetical protein
MATKMTTTITPMTMFLFSIVPSLAQIAGRRTFRSHEIWLQNDPAKRLEQGVPRNPHLQRFAGANILRHVNWQSRSDLRG